MENKIEQRLQALEFQIKTLGEFFDKVKSAMSREEYCQYHACRFSPFISPNWLYDEVDKVIATLDGSMINKELKFFRTEK
jgi:hypothetical protein